VQWEDESAKGRENAAEPEEEIRSSEPVAGWDADDEVGQGHRTYGGTEEKRGEKRMDCGEGRTARAGGSVVGECETAVGTAFHVRLPNVWRQRRAKRVRCTPGLGTAVRARCGSCEARKFVVVRDQR